jgi:hypothetical protein
MLSIGKEIRESMRRITLLLMPMATVLLAASGVAWAVTKTCPPDPTICWGTRGADVLKSTNKANSMAGKGGNDTYTHFVRGNFGRDGIYDSGGRDQLVLSNYSRSEIKWVSDLDLNNNGRADSVVFQPGRSWRQNYVLVANYWDDTRSKPPFKRGPGYIEVLQTKVLQTRHAGLPSGTIDGASSSVGEARR